MGSQRFEVDGINLQLQLQLPRHALLLVIVSQFAKSSRYAADFVSAGAFACDAPT
jgi:hypothetical protein